MSQNTQLNAVESALLNALYKTPYMTGDIIVLLRKHGIDLSLEEAKKIGTRLDVTFYIKYTETESSVSAKLLDKGIEYAVDPEKM
jgi:hypothetical protein